MNGPRPPIDKESILRCAFRIVLVLVAIPIASSAIRALWYYAPTGAQNLSDLGAPLFAAVWGAAAAYTLANMLLRTPWFGLKWALRAAMAIAAYVVLTQWRHINLLLEIPIAGFMAACLGLHHIAHRQELGWSYDKHGERQKVEGRIRGYEVLSVTTRTRRLIEEQEQRSGRRKSLFWSAVTGGPLAYFATRCFEAHQELAGGVLAFLAGIILLIAGLPNLVMEALYLAGWQDMRGHQVLDPPVQAPGIEDVHAQMAHGDASLADEAEAVAILSSSP